MDALARRVTIGGDRDQGQGVPFPSLFACEGRSAVNVRAALEGDGFCVCAR
jgi:hypothetical protein